MIIMIMSEIIIIMIIIYGLRKDSFGFGVMEFE